jgi:hypothetical protein
MARARKTQRNCYEYLKAPYGERLADADQILEPEKAEEEEIRREELYERLLRKLKL